MSGSKEDKHIEILSPAGSWESFCAAIAAGADAVYAGGRKFGARAFANNFSDEELLKAIDYAHVHGKRFYLTMNTLVKEDEFSELIHYLIPLYERGLDAVIVQDIGVFSCIRKYFPNLDIHISTQMTVTGAAGAKFLKDRGAVRVVPARELSLEEIRRMKQVTGMEIECFVHGALCYCYSGQCLLSSLIGGRSGNRGQCAQPCRLPYMESGKKGYFLSMKDICTLELIPDLIEAGIDSFKIEGRMKKPEYVAGVTAMYRKYTDLYLKKGRAGYLVSHQDKEALLDLFNRGGFHQGYYRKRNGQDMIALERPNHAGVPLVKVVGQRGRELTGIALTDIHPGDVVEFLKEKENYTFGNAYKKNEKVIVLAPKGRYIAKGIILNRIRNQKLIEQITDAMHFEKIKEKIYGILKLSEGKHATLTVWCERKMIREDGVLPTRIAVQIQSEMQVMKAVKQPLDEERIRKQLEKTGNTEFVFADLVILQKGDTFLPMHQLNEMRRKALDSLREEICKIYYRKFNIEAETINRKRKEQETEANISNNSLFEEKIQNFAPLFFSVLVETEEQLKALEDFPEISRIYVDSAMGGDFFAQTEAREICRKYRQEGKEIMLAMPYIFREHSRERMEKIAKKGMFREFDGILIRNYEEAEFVQAMNAEDKKENRGSEKVISDVSLYTMNKQAQEFWKKEGNIGYTIPYELNQKEIGKLGCGDGELVLYGYLPVMVSAQCLRKNLRGCAKTREEEKASFSGEQENLLYITDRTGGQFAVRNFCRDCYNVIYNQVPVCLFSEKEAIERLNCRSYRLQFTIENEQKVKDILTSFRDVFMEGKMPLTDLKGSTRGHFRRGIT